MIAGTRPGGQIVTDSGVSGSDCAGRPRIVAILPRGEALRNFVYTGTLDEVAAGADLSVLSVMPGEQIRSLLLSRYGDVRELTEVPERWTPRILRDLLDLAHNRWLWSEAARERWRLRDSGARTLPRRLQRIAKKAASRPFATAGGLELLSRLERAASRRLRTTDEYVSLYQQTEPTLVFNASHVHSVIAIQAVQAAQWLGIPTAAFIFSWDNLTSQGRVIPPYDHYLVWSEKLRDQLLTIYRFIKPKQVIVTGTPQFDFHFRDEFRWTREEYCRRVGADPERPIVLYSTGMANHMPGEPDVVESIADMVGEMPERPQLLVRVYPKDLTSRFDDLRRRRQDVLFPVAPWEPTWLTPLPEDSALLSNMIRHADVGINVASTISLELCMMDKPVINVAYNPPGVDPSELEYARYYRFDHYRPVAESGAVMLATSPGEMHAQIRSAIREPARQSAQRRALLHTMFGDRLDGNCGHRVAEALLSLAAESAGSRSRRRK